MNTKTKQYILGMLINLKGKHITSGWIIKNLQENGFGIFSGGQVRNLIHEIRMQAEYGFIIASSKGYAYTRNKELIKQYTDDLAKRINSQNDVLQKALQNLR